MVGLPAELLGWTTHVKKRRLGVIKGMLPVKKFCSNPYDQKNKQMAPSPPQLLNGQGVRRISGCKSKCHGIRFGTLNVGSLCGRKTEVCEEPRKRRVDVCCIQKDEKAKELVLWLLQDKGINCSGEEMMQDLEGLEFW